MVEHYLQNYFRSNIYHLKLIGFWPSDDKTGIKYWLYPLFLTSMIWIYNIGEGVSLVVAPLSLNRWVRDFGYFLSNFMSCTKMVNILYNQKKIKKMIETLQEKELEYETSEVFDPKVTIKKYETINYFFMRCYSYLIANFLIYKFIPVFVRLLFFEETYCTIDSSGVCQYCVDLPYDVWIPFEHNTKLTCFIATFLQLILVSALIGGFIVNDTLFMALVNFLTGHLYVLGKAFRSIPSRCKLRKKSDPSINLNKEMHKEMKKCVKHLIVLKKVCNEIEDTFKYMIFLQVFNVLLGTCTGLLTGFLVNYNPPLF